MKRLTEENEYAKAYILKVTFSQNGINDVPYLKMRNCHSTAAGTPKPSQQQSGRFILVMGCRPIPAKTASLNINGIVVFLDCLSLSADPPAFRIAVSSHEFIMIHE